MDSIFDLPAENHFSRTLLVSNLQLAKKKQIIDIM